MSNKKPSKLLYLDVETTGLVKYLHGIIQVAYIIEIDGQVKKRGSYKINPATYNRTIKVSPEALKANHYTIDQMKTFGNAKEACDDFLAVLDQYIDRWDWEDKFIMVGYNTDFDAGFIQEWFADSGYTKVKDSGYERYGQYIDYRHLDVFALVKYLVHAGKEYTGKSMALVPACKAILDLELDAHDAVADIEATRDLHLHLMNKYLKGE